MNNLLDLGIRNRKVRDYDKKFMSFIYYLVEKELKLTHFFKKMCVYGDMIDNEDQKEVLKNVEKLSQTYDNQEKIVEEKIEELKKKGVNVDLSPVFDDLKKMNVRMSEFSLDQLVYYYCEANLSALFNGISVNLDMLNDFTINPYEKKYKNWCDENSDIETKIMEYKKNINAKNNELKFSIFKRESIKNEIDYLEKQLTSLEIEYKHGMALKKQVDIYNNFSEEQKENIKQYFEEAIKLRNILDEFLEEKAFLEYIKNDYMNVSSIVMEKNNQRNKWYRVLERMLLEKVIQKSDIAKINNFINTEESDIKKIKGVIGSEELIRKGKDSLDKLNLSHPRMKQCIQWYIDMFFYEREKVNKNEKDETNSVKRTK